MLSETEKQQAAQIQATCRARVSAARLDHTINARERQRQMAKAVLTARAEIKALRDASDQREVVDKDKAYKQLFGVRSDDDRAYRDNLTARVADGSLQADGACALYDLAAARGDDLAMTALAELAWLRSGDEMGGTAWHPILDAHRGQSGANERSMTTLVAIVNPDNMARIQEKLELEVVAPTDMPGNLDFLASDQDAIDAPASVGANWQVASS